MHALIKVAEGKRYFFLSESVKKCFIIHTKEYFQIRPQQVVLKGISNAKHIVQLAEIVKFTMIILCLQYKSDRFLHYSGAISIE